MVLCAGFGTRLRPLTDELPKPLLPYGDRSLLEHAVRSFQAAGFAEVVANVHHLAERFEAALTGFGGSVALVHEPVLRGTAGGIAGARRALGPSPVLCTIGDVVLERIPTELVDAAGFGGLVLAVAPRVAGSGTVGIGAHGEVVRLRGERFGQEVSGGDYIGLCALGDRALTELPEMGCLVGDYALPVLREGGEVRTFAYRGAYVLPGDDLGSYFASQLAWLAERGLASFVADEAKVSRGVLVDETLIGARATVTGTGVLRRVVALPGATLEAPLESAIVAPSGRIIRIDS
ncbi:MAG TPA: NTP transferase domain-containing protein [Polyangiaceae bacterium]|nr:NTP transferase domain-containing protein [Polyangiaceae bacterium]